MYSWEIDDFLRNKDYKLTFTEARDVMQQSPQVVNWKMESLFSELEHYGKYSWKTEDGYQWNFYIKNMI